MNVTDWVQAIASAITCIVAIFMVRQLTLMKEQIQQGKEQLKNAVEWNKLSSTFTFFQSDQILERERSAIKVCKNHGVDLTTASEPITQEQLESIRKDDEAFEELRHFLNFIEDYCTAVHAGVLDEDASYGMMSGLVIRYASLFSPFLEMRRKEVNDEQAHIELIKLASVWKKKSDDQRDQIAKEREELQKTIVASSGVENKY